MSEVKMITHTSYTYETSDGSTFDDKNEAIIWQNHLSSIEDIVMLDDSYRPVEVVDSAYYVRVSTDEQVDAFNAMNKHIGLDVSLDGIGHHRFDTVLGDFVNVNKEIEELQYIIDRLDRKEDEGK